LEISKEPLKHFKIPSFPKDVNVKPIIFIVGKPRTRKTILADAL